MAVPFAQSAFGQTVTGNVTRIVVPFPPGGAGRGTIIVIENKPGVLTRLALHLNIKTSFR
jgi:hypothetical protein